MWAMRIAVLADTHAPRRWKRCPPAVAERLEGVDLILHASDVCRAWVLDELAVGLLHIQDARLVKARIVPVDDATASS
jgi:predicted phosphodiesterase